MPNQYTKAADEAAAKAAAAEAAATQQQQNEPAADPVEADGEIDDTPQGQRTAPAQQGAAEDALAEVSPAVLGSPESYDSYWEGLREEHETDARLRVLAERFQRGDFLERAERDELLQGLPVFKRVPIFNPAPDQNDPRRRLINLNLLDTPEDRLEWLRIQGRIVMTIPLDPFEAAKIQDPTNPTQRIGTHVEWNGIKWPAAKGRPIRMPWPIAEAFFASPMGEYQMPSDPEVDDF